MAPGTRRANRGGYTDHDDFEGLPVRQWRQEWADAAPPVQAEPTRKDDIWSVELRWGMPRDTGLLASHSQELLRAARSGRLYKRPSPTEEDEAEIDADKPDKKDDETATKGFQVKVWKQMTRNTDEAPVSHLAKRRKGVVTISSKTVTAQVSGATVTRATVRRTDAAGNPYTQEITLQEGLPVDGEIIATTVVPLAAVNEQPQPTPPRNRRPPPPKKNKKLGGPGRGRKKKMVPPPAPVPGQEGAAVGAPVAPKTEVVEGENAVKQEREDSNNPDSEMADNDDDDGDDDGEEGDEGEGEGEDGDENAEDLDQEMTDASPSVPPPSADTTMEITAPESPLASKSQAPPNPLLAPPLNPSLSISSPKIEGSPLKNVILPSPTEPSHTDTLAAAIVEQAEQAPVTEAITEVTTVVAEPTAADQVPAEQTTSKSPEPERPQVVEMDITITDAATFIPPAEQVGDIKSPEARSNEAQSPGVKSLEVQSPQAKSPEDKPSEVKPAEAGSVIKSPEAKTSESAPEAPAEEAKATPAAEQAEQAAEPQPPVKEVVPQVEEDTPMTNAPEVEDVKAPSPADPAPVEPAPTEPTPTEPAPTETTPAELAPSEAPQEVKQEVTAPSVSPPKAETAPAETAPEPSPPAPAVEEAPPSDPKPKSPSPAAAEEGPDLLAGLESALGQEREEERAKEPSAEAAPAAAPEAPAAEVKEEKEEKEEVQADVKQETKDEEPSLEEAAPPKEDGDAPAPATESSAAGPA